jgi:hypothetical protein
MISYSPSQPPTVQGHYLCTQPPYTFTERSIENVLIRHQYLRLSFECLKVLVNILFLAIFLKSGLYFKAIRETHSIKKWRDAREAEGARLEIVCSD